MRILGPAPAALERLKQDYRFQLIIKATNRCELQQVLLKTMEQLRCEGDPLNRITVDVDPVDLM
jgi:primosomal protein N' (replication factor Y)